MRDHPVGSLNRKPGPTRSSGQPGERPLPSHYSCAQTELLVDSAHQLTTQSNPGARAGGGDADGGQSGLISFPLAETVKTVLPASAMPELPETPNEGPLTTLEAFWPGAFVRDQ